MDELIEILTESVKRNGEKPLTNKWLLNILLMAERRENAIAEDIFEYQDDQDWMWK